MSLPRETMVDLMALADGELEGDARSRTEAVVASNEEARALFGEFQRRHLRSWVRESVDARGDAAGADAIVDGVMARIGAPRAAAMPAPARRVVRLRAWMVAGAAVLAAAAAIALYLRPAPPAGVATLSPGGEPGAESSGNALASGVEVDEIEAPSRGVSLFEIPVGEATAAAGAVHKTSSVVVWIDDSAGAR